MTFKIIMNFLNPDSALQNLSTSILSFNADFTRMKYHNLKI